MRRYKSYHFIGVGGIGMSAIAQMLARHGTLVSGSDIEETPLTRDLAEMGIDMRYGHHADHVAGAECVVYSTSIRADNPEMIAARARYLPVMHRSQALALLSRDKWVCAVSGTHGKTTTTSMTGLIFRDAGIGPTVVVGARVPEFGGNLYMGMGQHMIIEADESDSSFLSYHPQAIVVTNIDADHLDHFRDLDEIASTFTLFLDSRTPGAKWFGCAECPRVRDLVMVRPENAVLYGFGPECDFRAVDVRHQGPGGSSFTLQTRHGVPGRVHLSVLGNHNVLDALAAASVALDSGIAFDVIQRSLERFHGASRRFEFKTRSPRFTLVDDYAHHPAEIRATLAAARSLTPKKILAVFQPHRYTRTQKLASEFADAFSDADEVIVTDIYASSEDPIPGVNGQTLAESIGSRHPGAVRYVPFHELLSHLDIRSREDLLMLTLGAGNIGSVSNELQRISPNAVFI